LFNPEKGLAALPLNFSEIISELHGGKVTAIEAMKKLGMKKTTFYKTAKVTK
jgi:hypothetical protein